MGWQPVPGHLSSAENSGSLLPRLACLEITAGQDLWPQRADMGSGTMGKVGELQRVGRTVRAGSALRPITASLLSTCTSRTKAKENIENKFPREKALPCSRKVGDAAIVLGYNCLDS